MTQSATAAIVATALLVAGCAAPPEEDRPSEPAENFFPAPSVEQARRADVRWRRRDAQTTIVTKLRPTRLSGRFPAAYLRSITHADQPHARAIWDVVTLGLSLEHLAPLPVEKSTPWRSDIAADDLVLEIGGRASSSVMTPVMLARAMRGQVERRFDAAAIRGTRGLVHYLFPDDLSGKADNFHSLRCYDVCHAALVLPVRGGDLSSGTAAWPGTVAGLLVQLTFSAKQVPHWARVKRTAVCFTRTAVPGLDPDARSQNDPACADVRNAMLARVRIAGGDGRPDRR